MKLQEISEQNRARAARWHEGSEPWSGSDWSNAMCGEAGEVANVVKKLRRHETGAGTGYNTPPEEELKESLAEEIADVILYADLLAAHYEVDLEVALRVKFNRVSEAQGFPERLK
jgi:NTP pyrophosphatase (non-canonical NTP hydrolase)